MRIIQNHHRHSRYTNIRVPDSIATNEEYAKRASELGHGIISTMEHGHQGRYIEGYELAKKYNLKFVFGTEAYWVKNRYDKDRTNAHICIFARTENARQCINDILAEANITGFYYQPRIDLDLIYSLPKDEVIITTACVGFHKYEDDSIILGMSKYFGKNFFLEVQYHDTESQKKLNRHLVELSEAYNIPLMMGCDSHYIDIETAWERDDYLLSKGISYEDEYGWFLDYPDGDTAYERFKTQGILSDSQIDEAMNNTNVFLEVEEYHNPCFTHDIKMPTLYPQLSQEDKDEIFTNLIWEEWKNKKHKIPTDKHKMYETEIQKEIDTIIITKHADYFLLDYHLVKESIEKGGIITPSGRGSAVSNYTNNLLGLTKVDRISAKVRMYPERFMSATRILESKSLADIDLNLGRVEVFAQVQKELLGENCSYPMLAYGTMRAKSAWKMYAKAKNIDFELANLVSDQIEQYENDLKHQDEDSDEELDIFDYVNEKYHETLKDSEEYLGLISDCKPHPCADLLFMGNIRREVGLIMVKSKTGKKEVICTIMDGKWAEEYKFLKNDLLKVSVIDIVHNTYKKIGRDIPEENELLELCENNQAVWDVYKNGWTVGINQVEQIGTKKKVMRYQPKNISELCAFVAAIRPGFKSMYSTFEKRLPFSYNVPTFDNLIQTEEMPASFLLYQEMAMAALNFAGIPMSECYEVIKNIGKKRMEKVKAYKDIFLKGFSEKLTEYENKTKEEAQEISDMIWKILDDSCRYSFNASHSYCVATDSLHGAYLKSNHTLAFCEVFLNIMNDKSKKDRILDLKNEVTIAYNIKFVDMKFRQDNRQFTADKESNSIWSTLKSIKGFGDKLANQLFEISDGEYKTFTDLLICLEEQSIMCNKIEQLIKIKYFDEFGTPLKLHKLYLEFTEGKLRYNKSHSEKTKAKRIPELYELEKNMADECFPISAQLRNEYEILGSPISTYKLPKHIYILEVDTKNSPKLKVYGIATGVLDTIKVDRKTFNFKKINDSDIVSIDKHKFKPRAIPDGTDANGKTIFRQSETEKDCWLEEYTIKNLTK